MTLNALFAIYPVSQFYMLFVTVKWLSMFGTSWVRIGLIGPSSAAIFRNGWRRMAPSSKKLVTMLFPGVLFFYLLYGLFGSTRIK